MLIISPVCFDLQESIYYIYVQIGKWTYIQMEEKVKLGYRERDKLFKKYFSELKIKVALNWFELFALMAISSFICFKLLVHFDLSSRMVSVFIAIGISLVLSYGYCIIRKYKLSINRFDKERIYKRVSSELLDAKESTTK